MTFNKTVTCDPSERFISKDIPEGNKGERIKAAFKKAECKSDPINNLWVGPIPGLS